MKKLDEAESKKESGANGRENAKQKLEWKNLVRKEEEGKKR